MVDAIPVPDSRQKVDELFLFWLSEPSTQEMLRNELTKVRRYGKEVTADGGDSSIIGNLVQPAFTNIPRSGSPNYRTPSPPLHLSNSPKSPRAKRRAKSPRRNLNYGLGGSSPSSSLQAEKSAINGAAAAGASLFDEVDYFPSAIAAPPAPLDSRLDKKNENARAPGSVGGSSTELEGTSRDEKGSRLVAPCAAREGEVLAKSTTEAIPPFFFPNGQLGAIRESADVQLKAAAKVFEQQANGEIGLGDFHLVVKVIMCVCKIELW